MNRRLRIAHTSDVHLLDGSEGEAARDGFVRAVDAVLATEAELFLIAGDLFDHNRVRAPTVEFVYAQLARLACPTVVLVGNHDCWAADSVLRRMDFGRAGEHVTLLDAADGRQVAFPALQATVWGRCMEDHHPGNRPMAGAPPRQGSFWHIGMAHGLYVEEAETERSSLITPGEIAASGFDYLALGHVHVHRQMRHGDTLACYPGVPAPYAGATQPGCLAIVDLTPGDPVQAIRHPLLG